MGRIEIVDQKVKSYVRFDTLAVDETFRWDGKIYVKFDLIKAYSFQENRVSLFAGDTLVVQVNCKLIVEN